MNSARVWTVSQLTEHIRDLLEGHPSLQDLWLAGEISNLSRSGAGHLYFTLKDSGSALSCVMWRSSAAFLGWQPQQGDGVLAHGYISVYPVRGVYQLYTDQLRPAGRGDLQRPHGITLRGASTGECCHGISPRSTISSSTCRSRSVSMARQKPSYL